MRSGCPLQRQMPTMSRLQVQRTELVDAKPDSIRRAFAVKTPDSAVSWPEFRIARLLPGLRVLPANLATTQQLPQSFQRNRSDDLLFDQVVPQRRQRPDAHAEQLSRRREGHFHNLFDNVPREQDHADVAAVHGIGSMTFQAVQLRALPRAQLPCRDLVHDGLSAVMVVTSTTVENPIARYQPKYKEVMTTAGSAKLSDWKRH